MNMSIHHYIKDITPEVAKSWLEINHKDQRKINKKYVAVLAEDMTKGRWQFTHQGIAFSADGVLVDGQHRLLAIVKSGVTTPMLIVTGLSNEAILNIDGNRKRTVKQTAKMQGTSISMVAKHMISGASTNYVSPAVTKETYEKYSDVIGEVCSWFNRNTSLEARKLKGDVLKGIVVRAYACTGEADRLEEFVETLLSGEVSGREDNAALLLRKCLLKRNKDSAGSVWSGKAQKEDNYYLVEQAINDFLGFKEVEKLTPTKNREELFPLENENV